MKENSYLFRSRNPFFTFKKDELNQDFFKLVKEKEEPEKPKLNGFSEYLNQFWNRLIAKPEGTSQPPNSYISEILEEEEKKISANKVIAGVLSDRLKLAKNSAGVLKAIKESTQIFHEDFPGDFILEYKEKRLGLFLLDICYNSNHDAIPVYRFRADLKSFDGLH